MAMKIVESWTGPGRNDADIRRTEVKDNAAHPSSNKYAFEHWYFDAHLDNGYIVVGFLQTRELVLRKPGVELHVYSPDGTRREIIVHYSPEEATASTTECNVKIGNNYAYVDHGTGDLPVHRVHLAEGDLEFDLTFTNEVPTWKPGGGYTSYGDQDFFAWVVAAPKASVTGTVRIGSETFEAKGRGYADHNWGIGDMKRLIDRWYWGRLYVDEFTLVYANVLTQKKYGRHESRPLMLARGDEVVLSTGDTTLTEGPAVFDEVGNRTYPSWIRLQVPGSVDLRLTVQRVIHAHDYLADVPLAGSAILKPVLNRLLGRPGYFRFSSTFDLTVTREGRAHHSTGTTLHEMVALK